MSAQVITAPRPVTRLADRDVVTLAAAVLADPRAWAHAAAANLDPATLRAARARALALLSEALETV